MNRNLLAIAVFGILLLQIPTSGIAVANSLAKSMDGAFRGSGTTISGSKKKKIRVSCNLNNTYDEGAGRLKIKGKCAGSQGSRRVKGELKLSGNSVSGSFLAPIGKAKMTGSTGKISGSSMTMFTSFHNETTGKSQKFRQVVRVSGSGFKTSFFAFDSESKKYQPAGSITFKRK